MGKKILFVSNTDWTLYHHWLQNLTGLRDAGYELTLCSPDGPLVPKLRAAGFRHLTYKMDRGGMNLFREAFTVLEIGKVMAQEKPDLVHALTVKPGIYTSLLMRYLRITQKQYKNVPILNTYTGLGSLFEEHTGFAKYVLRPVLRFAFSNKHVWQSFLNDGNEDTFRKMGLIYKNQSFITPSEGVDSNKFTPVHPPKSGHPFVVLLAARILWSKGVAEFVEAARMLRKENPAYEFWLVGEPDYGNPQAISSAMLQEWEKEGAVRWLGHSDDMPNVFRKADILALPSYHEGAPKVIKEAFAAGLPVVASDIPGCRILVREGETGFLVPVKDAEALAAGIRKLFENDDLRRKMGENARKCAENELDCVHVVKNWVEQYKRLLP